MKTPQILPLFFLLLSSLVLIQTIGLLSTSSKLIGKNFESDLVETQNTQWNFISLRKNAQWKDIVPEKESFVWKTMDKAYQSAQKFKMTLKWDFSLQQEHLPNWLDLEQQKDNFYQIHERVFGLFEKVCGRYPKLDLISVEFGNLRELSQIAELIFRYCPNTKFLISSKNANQLNSFAEEGYMGLIDYHERGIFEGIELDFEGKKLDLSIVEKSVEKISEFGFPVYVSGIQVKKDHQQDMKGILQAFDLNHKIKGIVFDLVGKYQNSGFGEFAMMSSSRSARLLAISVSFTRTVVKWTLSCDSTGSKSPKPIVSYFWNWGDGTNDTITNGSKTAAHTYATSATFTVDLTMTDNAGGTGTASNKVTIVGNMIPTASFTNAITAYTVAVASTSTDSDGTVVGYSWNWGDNSTFDTTVNASHTYALAGTYTIILKVTDENGGVSLPKAASVTVPTTVALPVPRFTFVVNKLSISFDGSTSTDNFGTIISYFWTYGDGTTETTTVPTVTHAFASAKNYNVILQVTNNRTASASLQKTVTTVNNVAPTSVAPVATITGYDVVVTTTSSDSDGTITDYKWGWGDTTANTTTAVATGSHIYTKAGTFSLTLAVVDNDGATSSVKTISVTVPSVLPTANFISYVDKLFVTFDASVTKDPYGTVVTYAWNFGDTVKVNTTTPIVTHTFASAKSFNVQLQVTDDKGAVDSVTIATVTNTNALPVAKFNTPTTNGYAVSVVSTSTDSDGTISSYDWSWGDNTTNSTTSTASHTYTVAGTYTITLSVVDNSGATSLPVTAQVNVPSSPPVVSFTSTVSQMVVAFDASASTSMYGTITEYLWDFGDTQTQTTTVPTVSKTYATVGTFTVTLQVTDSKSAKGTLSKSVTTVANAVPIANFNFTSLSGYTANVASTSTDSDGTISTFNWSWGDSTANASTSSPSHTYTQAGTYTISLTVSDNDGSFSTVKTSTVTVPTVLPVSVFTTSANKMLVSFDASTSADQFGLISSYVWTFGDSSTVTTTVPTTSHTYTTAGTFTVTLKVIDNKNAQATSTQTVTTVENAAPTANFNAPSLSGYTANVVSTSTDTDGTISSYKWSWGDTTANSTTSSSTHTYTQAGTYTIGLIVVDNDGTESTIKTTTVTVPTALPVSTFTTSVNKMTVEFDGSTSTDQFGSITSYVWTFGDSSTLTTTTPTTSHTYTTVGTFTTTLKVIDNKNAQAISTKSITTVANVGPTAAFDISSLSGYTVNVASTSIDSDGTIATYKWSWGDSTANGTTSSSSHTYTQASTYTIGLIVVDNNGAESVIKTTTVTVPTVLPVSAFTTSVNKLLVTFDASTSVDQFGTISSYIWNFGDSNTVTTTTPTTTHTYGSVGTFSVILKIVDNKNSQATSTKAVTTVENNPPVSSFTISSVSGYVVNVLSTSTDSDGALSAYQWSWGDGTTNDTTSSASHVYNQAGTFEIKLSVKDNNGDWSSVSSYWATVPNALPVARFTSTFNEFVVSVDASTSSDGFGTISSYTWNWGDGKTETKSTPTATHTYLNSDLYVISLQVTNSKGVSSLETEKSLNAHTQTGLYPAWRWENFYLQRTVNSWKYFVSTTRWQANDGSIKYYHYFSKTF